MALFIRGANYFFGNRRVNTVALSGLERLFHAPVFSGMESQNGRAPPWIEPRRKVPQKCVQGGELVVYRDAQGLENAADGQVALGVTKGKYTTDPTKLTLEKSTSEKLRAHIAGQSRDGKSTGNVKGTIVVQYVDDEAGVQTHELLNCKTNVDGKASHKEGSDVLTEDWEFYTRLIKRNGKTLFESDEAGV